MSPASYQTAPPRDINGGERGIRTPAGLSSPVGFQDRSLQPGLGISPHQLRWLLYIITAHISSAFYAALRIFASSSTNSFVFSKPKHGSVIDLPYSFPSTG